MGKSTAVTNDSRLYGNIDARNECSNIRTFNNDKDTEPSRSNCVDCAPSLVKDTRTINIRESCQPYVRRGDFYNNGNRLDTPSIDTILKAPRVSYANAGDFEIGTYGYHDGDRLDCCLGIKRDNTSCAPCWCPQSTDPKRPCINALNRHCSEKNADGLFKIFDPNNSVCRKYKEQKPDSVALLKHNLCNPVGEEKLTVLDELYSSVSKTGCLNYCKSVINSPIEGVSCDKNIKNYCSSISTEKAVKEYACSCFMPQSFYDKLVVDMKNFFNLTLLNGIDKKPACIYPKCSQSELKPAKHVKCDTAITCVKEFNTTGGVTEDNKCTENTVSGEGVLTPLPVPIPTTTETTPTTPTTPTERISDVTNKISGLSSSNKVIVYVLIGFIGLLLLMVIISLMR
jgi:hypothetical protein